MRLRMNEERAAAEEEAARDRPKPAERLGGLLEGSVVLSPALIAGLVANPGTEQMAQARADAGFAAAEFRRLARPAGESGRALHCARARPRAGGA